MMNIIKLKTKKNVDNRSGKTGTMRIKKGICYAMLTGNTCILCRTGNASFCRGCRRSCYFY